jgi:hypothetical protein
MMGSAVVAWRQLDEFTPWLAIGILLLTMDGILTPKNLRQSRLSHILTLLFALGISLTASSIACDQLGIFSDAAAPAAFAGTIALALSGIFLSGRETRTIFLAMRAADAAAIAARKNKKSPPSKNPSTGVTILDLWRFAAAQWALLMVGAALFLAVMVPREDRLGSETIRTLVFLLPAAGVLPNAVMAAGICWWDQILRAQMGSSEQARLIPVPRVRAWLVALLLVNLGGLLIVIRGGRGPFGIPGAFLQIAAVATYLLGFQKEFWRGLAPKFLLAACIIFIIAAAALLIERITLLANPTVPRFYSLAWQNLWIGALIIWLLSLAAIAIQRLLPQKSQPRPVITLALLLTLIGTLLTTTIFLLAASQPAQSQLAIINWLAAGALFTFLGIAITGAILFRISRRF